MALASPKLQPAAPSPLARLNVLIADGDQPLSRILRSMLGHMGFRNVNLVQDGGESLKLLDRQPTDILITDWQMEPMDGMSLLAHLRQNPHSPNRMLPVIMLTARNERSDVEAARDAGVTEYVLRPFSARSVFSRIVKVVDQPRSFIVASRYIGPDRRHRSGTPPVGTPERRATRPKLITRRYAKTDAVLSEAKLILPDYTLRDKVGATGSIARLVTPEMMQAADQEVAYAEADALQWLRDDARMLRQMYVKLCADPATGAMLKWISQGALSVQSRAGMFGYTRAASIAASLHRICREYDIANEHHRMIMEKHVSAIEVIFTAGIKGDGGAAGDELQQELKALAEKYAVKE